MALATEVRTPTLGWFFDRNHSLDRFLLLTFLTVVLVVSVAAQQPFWDARRLAIILDSSLTGRYREALGILVDHSGLANPTVERLRAAYAPNSLLRPVLDTILQRISTHNVSDLRRIVANWTGERGVTINRRIDSLETANLYRIEAEQALESLERDRRLVTSTPALHADLVSELERARDRHPKFEMQLLAMRVQFQSIMADTIDEGRESRDRARSLLDTLVRFEPSPDQLIVIDRYWNRGVIIDMGWKGVLRHIDGDITKCRDSIDVQKLRITRLEQVIWTDLAKPPSSRGSGQNRREAKISDGLAYTGSLAVLPEEMNLSGPAPGTGRDAPREASITLNVITGSRESSLLDATATFIADRMKEEISIEFLRQMKKSDFVARHFPLTSRLLSQSAERDYSTLVGILRATVQEDLEGLLFTSMNWLADSTRRGATWTMSTMMLSIITDLYEGRSMPQTVRSLADLMESGQGHLDPVVVEKVRALATLAEGLADSSGARSIWIEPAQVSLAASNRLHGRVFVGLLYQRLLTRGLTKRLDLSGDNVANAVWQASRLTAAIQVQYEKLRGMMLRAERISLDDVVDVARRVSYLLDVAQATALTGPIIPDSLYREFRRERELMLQTYRAGRAGDYATVFANIYFLTDRLYGDRLAGERQAFLRYGSFFVALAQARTTEDLQKAIAAATLPAGSYSIKRESRTNLSLNAYGGGTAGIDFLKGDQKRGAPNLGFTAPIGISYTSNGTDATKPTSTWFLSLIDLGALVNFRLEKGTEALPTDVQLSSFVSPGLFFLCNAKEGPLSWGLGVSYAPRLRQLTTAGPVEMASSVRINAVLLIDIPLLNVYTQPRMDE